MSYNTKINTTFDNAVTYVDIGTLFCDNSHDQTINGQKSLSDVIVRGNLDASIKPAYFRDVTVYGNLNANQPNKTAYFNNVNVGGSLTYTASGTSTFEEVIITGNLNVNFANKTTTLTKLTVNGDMYANTTNKVASFYNISADLVNSYANFNTVTINGYRSFSHPQYVYFVNTNNNSPTLGSFNQSETGNYALIISSSNARLYLAGGQIDLASDVRIKKNVVPLDTTNALNCMRQLEPVSFEYIDGDVKSTGFIAQPTRCAIPDAVSINPNFIPNLYCMGTVVNINGNVSEIVLDHPIHVSGVCVPAALKLKSSIDSPQLPSTESMSNVENINCAVMEIHDSQRLVVHGDLGEVVDANHRVFVYGTYVHDFHVLTKDVIFTYAVAAVKQLDTEVRDMREEMRQLKYQLDLIQGGGGYVKILLCISRERHRT